MRIRPSSFTISAGVRWFTVSLLLCVAMPALAEELTPIYRETPLMAPNSKYYFSSRPEEQAATSGWKRLAVAFRAFSNQAPGTVPVYCETPEAEPHARYRFSTRPEKEVRADGWKRLFVAFYAYPSPIQGSVPVYEEVSTTEMIGLQYNYATRSAEEAQQYGWTRKEPAFWVPLASESAQKKK